VPFFSDIHHSAEGIYHRHAFCLRFKVTEGTKSWDNIKKKLCILYMFGNANRTEKKTERKYKRNIKLKVVCHALVNADKCVHACLYFFFVLCYNKNRNCDTQIKDI
jgi:hypothetical protein